MTPRKFNLIVYGEFCWWTAHNYFLQVFLLPQQNSAMPAAGYDLQQEIVRRKDKKNLLESNDYNAKVTKPTQITKNQRLIRIDRISEPPIL